jgi:hypothetical protein
MQPVAHVIVNGIRGEHPARIGQSFNPRRNIDAVAINVITLDDDIAKVDPDAYPATSAARTAAKRRTGDISGTAPTALLDPVFENVAKATAMIRVSLRLFDWFASSSGVFSR